MDARNALRKLYRPPEQFRGSFEEIKRPHDETSTTIRRVMLVLIAYRLFCFFKVLESFRCGPGYRDRQDRRLRMCLSPSIEFLVAGPLILLGMVGYLHIFVGQGCALSGREMNQALPYIFNMRKALSPRF